MPNKSIKFCLLTAIMLVAFSACVPFGPAPTNTPENTSTATETKEVVQFMLTATENAAETLTAMPTLTYTFTPTLTSTITNTPLPPTVTLSPTITNTFTPGPTFTSTATSTWLAPSQTPIPRNYECTNIGQMPVNGTDMHPNEDFDMLWTVKNTGKLDWEAQDILVYYSEGVKFQKNVDYFYLPEVKVGETFTIIVDMIAPSAPGTYIAVWGLEEQITPYTICIFPMQIDVVE